MKSITLSNKLFQNKVFLLSLAILLIALSFFIDKRNNAISQLSSTASLLEKEIKKKENKLDALISGFENEYTKSVCWNDQFESGIDWEGLYKKEGLALFIYQNNNLFFWSVNDVEVPISIVDLFVSDTVLQLKNAWYYISKEKVLNQNKQSITILKLILIKQEYSYENKYLTNQFHPSFGITAKIKISQDSTNKTTSPVYSTQHKYLFSIENNGDAAFSGHQPISAILFCIALFLLIYALWIFLKKNLKHRFSTEFIFIGHVAQLITIRYLMLHYQLPNLLYKTPLFNPAIYADSVFIPSLGDLLLHALFIFYTCYLFFKHFNLFNLLSGINNLKKIWIISFVLLHALVACFIVSIYVTKSLVLNSTISLNPDNIINFSTYSVIALITIGILTFSVFLMSDKILRPITRIIYNKTPLILLFSSIAIWFVIPEHHFFKISCIFIILITIAYIKIDPYKSYSLAKSLFLIILFSILFSRILFITNTHKEKEQRLYLAQQLIIERDYHAEFLFNEINNLLVKDTLIHQFLLNPAENANAIQKYISKKYFSDYWKKYEVQITACHTIDTLVIQPDNIKKGCLDYFTEQAKIFGTASSCPNLYFLNTERGRISYLGIIPINISGLSVLPHLFIEIDSKFIPQGLGYPELLLDFETKGKIDNSIYSYARYFHDTLSNHSGKYSYNESIPDWAKINTQNSFSSQNNYSHLVFKLPDSSIIMLSKKENTVLNFITYFSFTLVFFSLILCILLAIYYLPNIKSNYTLDLQSRVQISMSAVLILSLFFLGGGAITYITRIYNNRNTDILTEKTHSVLAELEQKMGKQNYLANDQQEYLSYYLEKFSNIFFTDINLYNLNGDLMASSRPKIFDEGLTGSKINPDAFQKLAIDHKNFFIHEENIGSMRYLSAYVQFLNYNNKPIAYLNLPYFAKQTEMQNEVLGFVVAVINAIVLLIVFSIIVALFIANRLTRPLSILQEKMKMVQLGKSNSFIEWHRDDEIGKLVNAYNNMITELARSAELLAKSERESAWKEMAKQVAHEIKNPLTPMKLSVQQLQRAWNDQSSDWDERIKRFTTTMIEQIDSLSSIATAFSNFAKMPLANLEEVNLLQILENTSTLYKSEKNIEISIVTTIKENAFVYVDKEQVARVFSNLIKNGIQAIVDERRGFIKINLYEEQGFYVVSIEDNGIGIAEDKQTKIFEPNFTTKSGGTGLGLAMSKNSIESFNGTISFTSVVGKGSTFFVSLPRHTNNPS